MSNPKAAQPAAMSRRARRPGVAALALALLLMTATGAPGEVRADTFVLNDGEVLEGSIIDGTRNTVVVQPAIGGMRQMPIGGIQEVRIDLAEGQTISGQLLGWADGVYQVRSGGEVIRIGEGAILSRAAGEVATGPPPRSLAAGPGAPQTMRMAAAPATSAPEAAAAGRAAPEREQMAARQPEGADPSLSAGAGPSPAPATREERGRAAVDGNQDAAARAEQGRAASGEDQGPATGERQSAAISDDESPSAGAPREPAVRGEKQSSGAGEERSLAIDEDQSLAAGAEQSLAAVDQNQSRAPGEQESLAVKASVDPAEPGADRMVFRIELSRPAEQTVVLIYGTVEGTAKAGEDFEPQQGVVTLAPGTKSAEVHVPLVEHPSSSGEKRFELFLTADPKVAEVVDRRVIATIAAGD